MTAIQEAAPHAEAVHDDHGHDHPSWLAHHFDDAEQQYDSGKLGMWLFLVTEVLFFSGMFCAYALYRNRNPEVFEFCSSFLNEKLGAINTGVLLFSSLTMAWAVRAAQLRQYRLLTGMLGATLGCAAIFLGVKAVEYSHKWELGLLPGRYYVAQLGHHDEAHHAGYLNYLMILPGILTCAFAVYYLYSLATRNRFHQEIAGPLVIAGACFFAGIGLGQLLEAGETTTETAAGAADAGHSHVEGEHAATADGPTDASHAETRIEAAVAETPLAAPESAAVMGVHDVKVMPEVLETPNADVNQKSMAGLFFSIYYCMTGIHAIHIIGGMLVITWLIIKASRREFHEQYFGPVDNVGLYWHLVDFIWIYLFPLLYLIT